MHAMPDVGDPAPDFTLESTEGPIHLAERLEEGCVLLVFYPADDTLVCTRQLCNYSDHLSHFEELGVQVIGVNDDPLSSHVAFTDKYKFTFPLASDPDRVACDAYGCLMGRLKSRRELIVVGEDGRIWWRHSELRLFRRPAVELIEVISELKGHV